MSEERFDVNNTDARYWAKEFMRLYANSRLAPQNVPDWVDESLMIGWFANAIEAGKMAGMYTRPQAELDEEKVIDEIFNINLGCVPLIKRENSCDEITIKIIAQALCAADKEGKLRKELPLARHVLRLIREAEIEAQIELMNRFMDDWNEKKFKEYIAALRAEQEKERSR